MNCTVCQAEITESMRFCPQCGTVLPPHAGTYAQSTPSHPSKTKLEPSENENAIPQSSASNPTTPDAEHIESTALGSVPTESPISEPAVFPPSNTATESIPVESVRTSAHPSNATPPPNTNAPNPAHALYCSHCGHSVDPQAAVCLHCGYAIPRTSAPTAKSRLAAGLLGIFLGGFGVHNFYLGYTNRAIAQLILCLAGFLFFILILGAFMILGAYIWGFVEGILILAGLVQCDANGNPLEGSCTR